MLEFYVSNKEQDGGAPFGRLLFHSDMMWSEHTFQVLSLYGVEVEPPASPTIFASAADGWATLPDDLRAEVESSAAVQGHDEADRANDPNVLVSTFTDLPTRTTPVALPHPRTGDTVLYVSQQMTQSIDGMEADESEALLERLFAHLYRDGVRVRARLARPRPGGVGQHRRAARPAQRHPRRPGPDAAQGLRPSAAAQCQPQAPHLLLRRLTGSPLSGGTSPP